MAEIMKVVHKVSKRMLSKMMLSKKDMTHVQRAIDECKKSNMLMKHGCIVANGTKILASGHNHYRTRYNDGFIKQSCSCHAEMDALRKISKTSSRSFKVRKKVGQRYEKVV
jgi:tRNA(Arg) A34 adenosine deaminase TadA